MALTGSIQPAPSGALGFDADSVVSLNAAQQFASQGYAFCVRYLSLGDGQAEGDLSPAESGNILAAGLGLTAVQHVRRPGWSPSAGLGQADGSHAAINAGAVGFPPGVNIWCDLEGVSISSLASDVIAHSNAWFAAVSAAGYVPGLYVGANVVLSGQQLYDLAFEHYWQSASEVPTLPARGYQMVQTLVPGLVNGIGIDKDVTQTDSAGGQAIWLIDTAS
jgi:hypothetical protein